MIKYMLTSKCTRNCSYCITRNIKSEECNDYEKIQEVLESLKGQQLMITGGEPTCSDYFEGKTLIAKSWFKELYLTTQNEKVLRSKFVEKYYKSVTFSLHGRNPIPKVEIDIPVYASILIGEDKYKIGFIDKLKKLGYKGLTANEDQRGSQPAKKMDYWSIGGFSFKLNPKGNCMDETIILPNLKIINNFVPYL